MENWSQDDWAIIIVLAVIIFFVGVLITRWIFGLAKHFKYQEVLIKLMIKIASGETLTPDEKKAIMDEVNRA